MGSHVQTEKGGGETPQRFMCRPFSNASLTNCF